MLDWLLHSQQDLGMFLFIVDICLILTFAWLITHLLNPGHRTAAVISLFIAAYADIVLVTELCSLISLVQPVAFLVGHLALAVLALMIWLRWGRHDQRTRWNIPRVSSHLARLNASVKTCPILWLFGIGVLAIYLFGAFLILSVPPNNNDAMSYHLARVGYWHQHATLAPWPTHDARRTTFPPNAEIGILWSVVFLRSDQFAGFVQWLSAIIAGVAIFGLARQLGYSREASSFAALLWATFPEILFQSTSTLNDLVVSAFFVSSIYLLYLGLQSNRKALLLSGMAFGLALGTKSTMLFILPGLAVTLLLLVLAGRVVPLRLWVATSATGFLILGSFIFMSNWLTYQHPLGLPANVEELTRSPVSRADLLVTNLSRYAYQMVDVTGLPDVIAQPLHDAKASISRRLFAVLNIPTEATNTITFNGYPFSFDIRPDVHEDAVWFGPHGFLVLLPAFLYQTGLGIKRKDPLRLGLAVLALSFLLAHSALQTWTPFKGRYYVLPITLCAPMMAAAFTVQVFPRIWRYFVVVTALIVMVWSTLHSATKPLLGTHTIWNLDEIGQRTVYHPEKASLLRMVDTFIPPDTKLGLLFEDGQWEYPLFGKHFSRKLQPICTSIQFCFAANNVDPTFVSQQDIDFLLAQGDMSGNIPPGFQLLAQRTPYQLLYRADADFSTWNPALRHKLLDASQAGPSDSPLVNVQPLLKGLVGIDLDVPPPLFFELEKGRSFIWLGQGAAKGLMLSLWSDTMRTAVLRVDVAAGPSRQDKRRTVQLVGLSDGKKAIQTESFTGPGTLWFPVQLRSGRNNFSLLVADAPTVQLSRELLVAVRHITVTNEFISTPSAEDRPLVEVGASVSNLQANLKPIAPWAEEVFDGRRFLWLGHGVQEGARLTLSSFQEQSVILKVDAAPGPGRSDSQRTLTMINERTGESLTRQFNDAAQMWIPLKLLSGQTTLTLSVSETANVAIPNDSRSLLARINHIGVFRPVDVWQAGPPHAPFITVAAPLWGVVGIEPELAGISELDTDSAGSYLTLVHGQPERRFTLWAMEASQVVVELDVAPSIIGSEQTIAFATLDDETLTAFSISSRLRFPVNLKKGKNDLLFGLKDSDHTTSIQSGGVVLVRGVAISDVSILSAAGPLGRPLAVVAESLNGQVGVDVRPVAPWPIEYFQSSSFFWLGHGPQEGLHLSLWSNMPRTVTLSASVEPGPGRDDKQRTLQIVRYADKQPIDTQQFAKPTSVSFTLSLQTGRNDFVIAAVEPSTVSVANDARSLIIKLSNIQIR
jgi:hypothetical protein